jgi:polyhydroxyalkanoate synthesis repressor PhaR
MRMIYKYPNRRLYDRAESRYITLNDIRDLVLNGVEFSIRDRRTQADISRAVLLQVLAESEESAGSQAVLSPAFLKQAIRAHGGTQAAEIAFPAAAVGQGTAVSAVVS